MISFFRLPFCLLALLLFGAAAVGALPEAIVPTNSLPPAAGTYELWPPTAIVRFTGSFIYDGTNVPCQFDLQSIKAGSFTNIVRTASSNDQVLEFDAVMSTLVPYMRLGGYEDQNLGLSAQIGHLRVRVVDGELCSTGRFALAVESFSWTLQSYDDEGHSQDVVHVRLRDSPPSTGWIEVTDLLDGTFVMQSELMLWPEGTLVPFMTNYVPAVTGPARLVLRGTSRTLQVLFAAWQTVGAYTNRQLVLYNSLLGPDYQYGIEYTTNSGALWQDFSITNLFGDEIKWFGRAEMETWWDSTPVTPMKWFRLKARRWP